MMADTIKFKKRVIYLEKKHKFLITNLTNANNFSNFLTMSF